MYVNGFLWKPRGSEPTNGKQDKENIIYETGHDRYFGFGQYAEHGNCP